MFAHEVIAKPENWCKGEMAMDVNGNPCDIHGAEADSFCMQGAVLRAYPDDVPTRIRLYSALDRYLAMPEPNLAGTYELTSWNDAEERTHAEVLAALRYVELGEV